MSHLISPHIGQNCPANPDPQGLQSVLHIRQIVNLSANSNLSINWARQIKIVFFDNFSTTYLLPQHFEKWYPAATPLSLIPYGEAREVKSEGLAYELNHPVLKLGTQTSSSNAALKDGIVKITYESGDLL